MTTSPRYHKETHRSCCATSSSGGQGEHENSGGAAPKATDPVCGMSVDPATAKHSADHEGKSFHFCSAGCRQKFVHDPGKYLNPDKGADKGQSTSEQSPDAIYTCPMHPEIQQEGPGSCPKCGMALEPLVPTVDEDDSELLHVRRKFLIASVLAIPLLLIAMGPHLLGLHFDDGTSNVLRWAEFLLATPLVLWLGAVYYVRGWKGVLARSPNMYSLIGLGVIVA
jgi:P-type Cu+ transporter